MSNTDPIKIRGWALVLAKGKQFLNIAFLYIILEKYLLPVYVNTIHFKNIKYICVFNTIL